MQRERACRTRSWGRSPVWWALVVAVLAVPLSLVGDRVGGARVVQGMALLWSLATVACALVADYGQLFAARVLVGVGEAAYGSVVLASRLTVGRR
jgi:predicted MFS family arabinose efflux permease